MQQAVKRMARPDAASEVVSTVLKAKVSTTVIQTVRR